MTAIDGISSAADIKVLTVTTLATTTVHPPNNNPPYFLPAFYNIELPVETPPGEYVGAIFAYDDNDGWYLKQHRFLISFPKNKRINAKLDRI